VDRVLVRGLRCRLCGKLYPKSAQNFCTDDFGPLEVDYDYDAVGATMTRAAIMARPRNMWRYRELLPIDGDPTVGRHVGGTPLIRADRLAKSLGIAELYVKNDAVNHPSLSFKDRVVAVAENVGQRRPRYHIQRTGHRIGGHRGFGGSRARPRRDGSVASRLGAYRGKGRRG